MEQKHTVNRWCVLWASALINFCISSTYAWSVFSGPLMELFGWTAAATAITYTIVNVVGPIPMVLGGKILNKYGPKVTVRISATIFCGGMFLMGFAKNVAWMYITYGLMCGVSMAIIYICSISNTLRFFSDKRGFASGILTAGSGMSSIVAAPVAQILIDNMGVLQTFRIMGTAYYLIMMLCTLFLVKAPKENTAGDSDTRVVEELTSCQMIKTGRFYLLVSIFAMGAIGGVMVISQASSMAQTMIGVSSTVAALGVSIVSFGNTIGRIMWGIISDRFGRYNTLPIIFAGMAFFLFVFSKSGEGQIYTFFSSLVLIGMCFGGLISLFPAITTENFGVENSGSNYGIVFSGYAIASMFGPSIAVHFSNVWDTPYSAGLVIATIICLCGMVLCLFLRRYMKSIGNRQSKDEIKGCN